MKIVEEPKDQKLITFDEDLVRRYPPSRFGYTVWTDEAAKEAAIRVTTQLRKMLMNGLI